MNILSKNDNGRKLDMELTVPTFGTLMRSVFNAMPQFRAEFLNPDFDSRLGIEVKENAVEVTLPAPGCKNDDFEIEVVGDFITIRVHREDGEERDDVNYIMRERNFAEFEESATLPVAVNGADAGARYVDGVLTVMIPRIKDEGPKSHTVKIN